MEAACVSAIEKKNSNQNFRERERDRERLYKNIRTQRNNYADFYIEKMILTSCKQYRPLSKNIVLHL